LPIPVDKRTSTATKMMVGLTLAAMLGVPVANLLGLRRWLC
jgi:predicted MFS family arabinose efflux permease